MKKTLLLGFPLLLALVLFQSYAAPSGPDAATDAGPKVKYSKKVNAIIQDKCYGCHSPEGKSDKAKQKLLWDDLPNLAADEQGPKVESILNVLKEGKMPPARFLEGNPDKKLTEDETATMMKWAEKTTKKLTK